jgi:exopolysaccharide biosynthesis polyprenyl glycosylphosphotransferase
LLTDAAAIIAMAGGLWAFGDVAVPRGNRDVFAILLCYLFAARSLGAYRRELIQTATSSAKFASLALVAAAGIEYTVASALDDTTWLSSTRPLYVLAIGIPLLAGGRAAWAAIFDRCRALVGPNVLILGDDKAASGRTRDFGAAIVSVEARNWHPTDSEPAFLEDISTTLAPADRVLLSFSDSAELERWIRITRLTGVDAEVLDPRLGSLEPLALRYWGTVPTLVVARSALDARQRIAKRTFDLVLALIAAPLAIPLIGFLALIVRLDSPGPAFFVQMRVGQNNRSFPCYKLRTMAYAVADRDGIQSTLRGDSRITRFGAFLRRMSLDELPQLWNVIKGEMSLVGPRPHALASTAEGALFWEVAPDYWRRHAMKPGLTGLAQVRGFRGATHSREDVLLRVAADLEYVKTWSFWLDVKILVKTIRVMAHRNAY